MGQACLFGLVARVVRSWNRLGIIQQSVGGRLQRKKRKQKKDEGPGTVPDTSDARAVKDLIPALGACM